MNNLTHFDILVVYTESLAISASNSSCGTRTPFAVGGRNESYNVVYLYFLEVCRRYGLSAALSTSADIVGPGSCSSYWTVSNKSWVKSDGPCFSNLIFDKFSPTKKGIRSRRKLLFSSEEVKSFNDPSLFSLFFDKQKTYDKLTEYTIPTVSVERSSPTAAVDAYTSLLILMDGHPKAADFSQDVILKDRFGAGGRHIYRLPSGQPKRMATIIRRHPNVSFVLQPFAIFDVGFCYKKIASSTDIRLIYLNGKIAQSYIRVAKQGDFRCNEHQGGALIYLSIDQIPVALVEKANLIAEKLNNKCSLYALDFIITNKGNIYLLEGNTGPGLDWNVTLKRNELEAKRLIRLVVKELSFRVERVVDCRFRNVARNTDRIAVGYSVIV